jgi:hypothetical protein
LPQSEKVSLDAFEVRFRNRVTRSRAELKLAIFISFYDLRLMIRNLLSLVINDTFCFTYKGIGCVKFQYRKKSQPTVSFAEGACMWGAPTVQLCRIQGEKVSRASRFAGPASRPSPTPRDMQEVA